MKKWATFLGRYGFVLSFLWTALATIRAFQGNWADFGFDVGLFTVAAACTLISYRIAGCL